MNQLQVNIPYQHKHSRLSVLLRPILIIPIISIMFMMLSPNLQINFSDITGMIQGQTEQNNRYNSYHEVRDGDGGIHTNMLAISTKDISDITETITSQSPYIQTMIAALSYILIAPIVAFMLWSMYIVNIPVIFTLLFRKKYPDWWFSWNQSLQSFVLRIYCYALFLTDQYPSLESKTA